MSSDFASGPKLYIAFGNSEERDIGTTRLHIDVTDAHNLMVWATNPREAGAVWHVFPAESRATLQEYLRSLPKCKGEVDPILAQTTYLTQSDLENLERDHGVTPWVIEQRVGEQVFIPAGCPHQVAVICIQSR